jgi:sterol desaturase/sphingolipid hydroxylase (fatty acid hydroxylase superfamily)
MLSEIIFDTIFYLDWRSILVGLLVFAPLERIFPLRKTASIHRHGMLTDIAHFFLTGIFARLGLSFVVLGATALGAAAVPAGWQARIGTLPVSVQVIFAALIADLGLYLAHRAMH